MGFAPEYNQRLYFYHSLSLLLYNPTRGFLASFVPLVHLILSDWEPEPIFHGDGLGDPDKSFKLLRKMFHNHTLQTMFSALHPRWSVELGLSWAKKSRLKRIDGKEPDYMGEDKEFLVLYTKEYLKSHPTINYFIYGHRHIMSCHYIRGLLLV